MASVGGTQFVQSQNVLSEKYFRDLASKLGPEWEALATHLDFKHSEITKIKMDNPGGVNNQIFRMLIEWSQKTGSLGPEAKCTLIECLRKVERNDLADELQDTGGNQQLLNSGVTIQPMDHQPTQGTSTTDTSLSYSDPNVSIQIDNLRITGTNSPVFLGSVKNSVLNFNS